MITVEGQKPPAGSDPSSQDDWSLGQPSPRHSRTFDTNRTVLVRDRRRFYRVRVDLQGRYMRADKQEYACQVVDISPGGVALLAPVSGELGERIIVYLDHLGRFEGELVRTFPGGFAVRLASTGYKREKIANQLTWIVNKHRLNEAEERAHERIVPGKQHMTVTLSDGSEVQARILDVSLGGTSVSILPKPPIGEKITIGLLRGTVVRHHDQGVGIRFDEIQDPATIELQFG